MIHNIIAPIRDTIADMTLFTGNDTRLAGVVVPITKAVQVKGAGSAPASRDVTFPASCDVSGRACYEEGRYFDLLPNDRYKTVAYFEQQTDVRYTGFKDGTKDKIMTFETDVRLVCWVNAKKLGYADCSVTGRIVLGMITALSARRGEMSRTSGRFDVEDEAFTNAVVEADVVRQLRRDASIFSRYTLPVVDLLYPWDFFALDIRCAFHVGRECFEAVAVGEEITC